MAHCNVKTPYSILQSVLSAVFLFHNIFIGSDLTLHTLFRSFSLARPRDPVSPPAWELDKILRFLRSEPLQNKPLRISTQAALFLLSLTTVRRVGELHVLSGRASFRGNDAVVSDMPWFVAKPNLLGIPFLGIFVLNSSLTSLRI